jgi:transposase-like protein
MELDEVLRLIRGARFSDGVRCPRCGASGCIRWGHGRGRQRYRCPACRRTFNDLTGTAAAFVKKLTLWPLYGLSLDACVSVRKAALRTGVHPSTAFRWRHRLLAPLCSRDTEILRGWIELGSAWFMFSQKGARNLGRPPRRPSSRPHWPDIRSGVNVLIAADRTGHILTDLVGPAQTTRIEFDGLRRGLADRVLGRLILVSEVGPYGPASRLATSTHGEYHDARPGKEGPDSHLARLDLVRDYRSRLYRWLRPFRGVATRYLPHYLAWHRAIDRPLRNTLSTLTLRWPLASSFG